MAVRLLSNSTARGSAARASRRWSTVARTSHHAQHATDEFGVQRGGRFVEEHQLRFHGERACDGDPLLLAS